MKHIAKVSLTELIQASKRAGELGPHYLEPEHFWKIAQPFPSSVKQVPSGAHKLELEFETGTAEAERIIEHLRSHGVELWWQRIEEPPKVAENSSRYVRVEGNRKFTRQDYLDAEYFNISSVGVICEMDHGRETFLEEVIPRCVPGTEKKKRLVGHMMLRPMLVCRSAFRSLLEEGGFRGLEFRPVKLGKDALHPDLHLIASTVTLPRFTSPRMQSDKGVEWNGVIPPGSWINLYPDDVFNPLLLTYRRSELESVGAFDVAETSEPINAFPCGRKEGFYIVSRRFRDWCQEKDVLKHFEWFPVAVED